MNSHPTTNATHHDRHRRAAWQLPPGVARGTWDYVHSDHVADDYDDYFQFNDLFEFDVQFVRSALLSAGILPPARLIDLGSGTGRALIPLIREGYRGTAIDLSSRMLEVAAAKAALEELPIQCVKANLVDLDGIRDSTADAAFCLFSTLGMIRGHANRQKAVSHARRIVRPGGVFVIHVHNYWYNLYDPGGPRWLIKNAWDSCKSTDVERGDKYYPYRGVQNMFLHVFTRRELRKLLRKAGFQELHFSPLHRSRQRTLHLPWLASDLRANGWMIRCR